MTPGPTIYPPGGRSPQSVALTFALGAARRPADLLPAWPLVFSMLDRFAGSYALLVKRLVTVERVDAGQVPAELVRARKMTDPERVVLLLHGGGFVFGSPASHRALAESLSVACRAEVLVPDFRLLPAASVADMVADCLVGYHWLLQRHDSSRIVICGDSSGANLAFATAVAARDAGIAMPSALVGLSGWLDLAYEPPRGGPRDPLIAVNLARRIARLCHENGVPSALLCPLDRDVSGLPPVLLQCGVEDPVRDGNERMRRHLAAAGVSCELQLWSAPVHNFQMFGRLLPEARAAIREIGRFAESAAAATPTEGTGP